MYGEGQAPQSIVATKQLESFNSVSKDWHIGAYWCLNIFGSSLEKICRKLKQSWLEFSVVLKSVSFTLLCRDQTLSVSVSDGIRNKIEREPQREAAVSFRTVVTFVT